MPDKTDNSALNDKITTNSQNESPIKQRFCAIEDRIEQACQRSGRALSEVRLLAVSKTRPAREIRALHQLGVCAFGENYASDALAKQAELSDLSLEWHFIGPLQSNKCAPVAAHFDWVQSVDRAKIVRRLADLRPAGLAPLNVLIQVNIDQEPQKAGCEPGDIAHLAELISQRTELKLRGLMAIPAAKPDHAKQAFEQMNRLFAALKHNDSSIDTLSIGMSGDLELAIEAGSSMVRIGTDLFGPRNSSTTQPTQPTQPT